MKKVFLCLFISIFLFQINFAQTYLVGETYFGTNDYIEYKAGNLPIIISAPHGGSLEPTSIPDRNCAGCVYVKDSFTEELIREMYNAIYDEFGCYPHVIINRLHRRKLDANRSIGDAADGNLESEQAWNDFQNFIETAKDSVEANFGKGLYLDLHGHGHEVQRLELGYRITKSELQLSNSDLNNTIYIDDASIKNLVSNNLGGISFTDLLRGANSFGQLYENENVLAVPSQNDPFPLSGESYFSGGYNTERYGSKLGGTIDGIQIECNMDGIRDTPSNREEFAKATATVLKKYMEEHYFGNEYFTNTCLTSSIEDLKNANPILFQISPNPVNEFLNINFKHQNQKPFLLTIFNPIGQVFLKKKYEDKNSIQISTQEFSDGIYFVKIENPKVKSTAKIIILKK